MFGFFKKAFRVYLDTYGEPGTGVTVYSTPDSLLDFYRMTNVRLPLPEEEEKPSVQPRRASIWGGHGAAHLISYRLAPPCTTKAADC